MGQYYRIVNLTKKEYIQPHDFNDGAKLLEFGLSVNGTMAALAVLLADGNNRGGGDLRSDNPIIGSWAGNRIVVTGDYADEGKWGVSGSLYKAAESFRNIRFDVLKAMAEDDYMRSEFIESFDNEVLKIILTEEHYKAAVLQKRLEDYIEKQ